MTVNTFNVADPMRATIARGMRGERPRIVPYVCAVSACPTPAGSFCPNCGRYVVKAPSARVDARKAPR